MQLALHTAVVDSCSSPQFGEEVKRYDSRSISVLKIFLPSLVLTHHHLFLIAACRISKVKMRCKIEAAMTLLSTPLLQEEEIV